MSNPDLFAELSTKLSADIPDSSIFPAKRPLLAHYTSIAVLEQIVTNKEVWFSHPMAMNDHEEMIFGMNLGSNAFRAHRGIVDACGTKDRYRRMQEAFGDAIRNFWNFHAFDTYVFSASLHEDEADKNGKLSLWRGYGGNGTGAAIVFNTANFSFMPESPFIVGPVSYESRDDRANWAMGRLDLLAELIKSTPIPDDQLHIPALAILERFKLASIFSKDIGFKEEVEWRVVYRTDRDSGGLLKDMLSHFVGSRGIEPKLKLKIRPLPGVLRDDTNLEKFIDHVILGPSQTSGLALPTVQRMLAQQGMTTLSARVYRSLTPFRPT